MGEALTQVKSAMGPDAVILHTRTLQTRYWLGLRRRELVEITAGKGLNVGSRNLRRQTEARGASSAGTYARPSPRNTDLPRNAIEGGRQLLETPAGNSAALLSISQEMSALRGMVKDLITQTRQHQSPNVPEDLFDYYVQLISNEVAQELAGTRIIKVDGAGEPVSADQSLPVGRKLNGFEAPLAPAGRPDLAAGGAIPQPDPLAGAGRGRHD